MSYLTRLGLGVATAVIAMGMVVSSAVPAAAASSAALSITPKKNYTIKSGGHVKDKLTIKNLDDTKSLKLSLRVVDFTYTDDGGTPKLMLDKNAPMTTWSLKPYLNVPQKTTVKPGASKTLPIDVSMASKVGAGSYYSAIVYSAGQDDFSDSTNVGLSASGVTLVFASVPGKVKEQLDILKLGAYQPATSSKAAGYSYFNIDKPTTIGYTLENKGNVVESPVGSITLKDLFGNTQVIDDINPSQSLALIGQSRTFRACLKLKGEDVNFKGAKSQARECATPQLWPGHYTATIDAFYGQNGNNTKEIIKSAGFWYLPLWFIFIAIVVLLALAYAVWRIVQKVRDRRPRSSYRKNK